MKKKPINDPIRQGLQQYLALRKSMGRVSCSTGDDLTLFVHYLLSNDPNCRTISRELIINYLDSRHHLQMATQLTTLSNLRQFCRFMIQLDPDTYIPDKGLVHGVRSQRIPYIFTEEEIARLMMLARKPPVMNRLPPYTYATIIGLLWATGMRIGEVIRLKIDDVDLKEGIIIVRQTKCFKSRFVPLSSSTTQALIRYKKERVDFGFSEQPGTVFF